jgi:hypothetical protein
LTDAALSHGAGGQHGIFKLRRDPDIDCLAGQMLAVLGNAKDGPPKHFVGRRRAIGRQYGGPGDTNRVHHVREEIEDADVNLNLLVRVEVTQKIGQLLEKLLSLSRLTLKKF